MTGAIPRGVLLAAFLLVAAPAHAATLEVFVDNPTAGTSALPNRVNVDLTFDSGASDEGTGAPVGTMAFGFDRGLRLGEAANAPACAADQVLSDESRCPTGSRVGGGQARIRVPGADDGFDLEIRVTLTAFNAPGGRGLALLATSDFPEFRTLVPVALRDDNTLVLTWPAQVTPPGMSGPDSLIRMSFTIGIGFDPAGDNDNGTLTSWVGATGCSTGAWAFTATAADTAGTVSASASEQCESAPPADIDDPGVVTLPPSKSKPKGRSKASPLCAGAGVGVKCVAGNGRRTAGGNGKVSHKGWPAVTGAIMIADHKGRTMVGSPRNDELLGANGDDRITGNAGNDIIWGDEYLHPNGPKQRDRMSGGAGADWIYTSHGTNTVTAGSGHDTVYAYYGHGTVDCGGGDDMVWIRRLAQNQHYTLRNCERQAKL